MTTVSKLELDLEVGAPQIACIDACDSAMPMALFARFLLRA